MSPGGVSLAAVEIDVVIRTACEHFELEQGPLLYLPLNAGGSVTSRVVM